jgi:uncharacterized protein
MAYHLKKLKLRSTIQMPVSSYDPDHSQDEDRYILLGMSESFKLIVVCHVYRQNDESIRIISARRATKTEQREYRGYLT